MGGPAERSIQTSSRTSKRRKSFQGGPLHATDQSKRALYHCNNCQKDISNTVRIKCAVCPDFDLCLECFSVGVQIHPHRNDHSYRVVDNLSFPLFHPDWGADEELLILEGVDMFGLGNWAAVAEHVGTKDAVDCQQHYTSVYINSPAFPEPMPLASMANINQMQVGKDRQRARQTDALAFAQQAYADEATGNSAPVGSALESGVASGVANAAAADDHADDAGTAPAIKHEVKQEDAAGVGTSGGPASTAPAQATSPGRADGSADVEMEEGTPQVGGRPAKKVRHAQAVEGTPMHDVEGADDRGQSGAQQGSKQPAEDANAHPPAEEQVSTRGMPAVTLREAAATLAASQQQQAGPASQRAKVQVGPNQSELTGYNVKRHEFDPEYDQDAELLIAELEFREEDTPEEQAEKVRLVDVYNARLIGREQRRAFIRDRGLLNVKRMQESLLTRLPGLPMHVSQEVQAAERRRTAYEREFHARLRPLARYQPQPDHEVFVEGLLLEARLRARILELKEMRRAGVRTFAEAEVYEADRKRRALEERGARGDRQHARHPLRSDADDAAILAQASEQAGAGAGGGKGRYTTGTSGVSVASQLAAWRARRGVALDITALPGLDTLSAKERELCASVRMLPGHYLAIKAAMLREAARRGSHLPRSEARTMFRLEPSRALRVYDLLASAGWIRSAPPPAASAAAAPAPAVLGSGTPLAQGEVGTLAVPTPGSEPAQPGTEEQLQGAEVADAKATPAALTSRGSFPGFDVPK